MFPWFIGLIVLASSVTPDAMPASNGANGMPAAPVIIDFFYEEGCIECARVKEEVLPVIEGAYPGRYILKLWNVANRDNYLRLAAAMERFGARGNEPVFMLVDNRRLLAGFQEIAAELLPAVEERLSAPDAGRPPEETPAGPAVPERTDLLLNRRLESFTVAGVVLGGLVDGINPCAIATLVFLMSVLAMSRTAGRHLLLIGAMFCTASFITYTAIGLGLLQALHALSYFRSLQRVVDAALILFLAALALLSFRDAFRFKASHKARDITLQLPDRIKQRIHRMLRNGLGTKTQLATAFALGMGVTALESVCTGQVYVPTLAFVVRSGVNVARGTAYLLLYNLMFVLPLIVVFLLTYRGMQLTRLMRWSQDNVFASKLLLGSFFLAMAAVMLLLR